MANTNDKTPEIPAEPFYIYSEDAHNELRSAVDCMVLLCLLTQSRADDPIIPMAQWTSFFRVLGTYVSDVLDAAPWHEGV